MIKKYDCFQLLRAVFCLFGIIVATISVFGRFVGSKVGEVSTLFSMGNSGIAFSTVYELFMLSLCIAITAKVFRSDVLLKNTSNVTKIVITLIMNFVITTIFILIFKWFEITMLGAWIGYLTCFGISSIVSVFVIIEKEKLENKQMELALGKYKENLQ